MCSSLSSLCPLFFSSNFKISFLVFFLGLGWCAIPFIVFIFFRLFHSFLLLSFSFVTNFAIPLPQSPTQNISYRQWNKNNFIHLFWINFRNENDMFSSLYFDVVEKANIFLTFRLSHSLGFALWCARVVSIKILMHMSISNCKLFFLFTFRFDEKYYFISVCFQFNFANDY